MSLESIPPNVALCNPLISQPPHLWVVHKLASRLNTPAVSDFVLLRKSKDSSFPRFLLVLLLLEVRHQLLCRLPLVLESHAASRRRAKGFRGARRGKRGRCGNYGLHGFGSHRSSDGLSLTSDCYPPRWKANSRRHRQQLGTRNRRHRQGHGCALTEV